MPAALLLTALCAGARTRQACGAAASQAAGGRRLSVTLTALDGEKRHVTTLKPEDLRLTVDGSPREILELRRQGEQPPLFLAVVIDVSASQESLLPETKAAADDFVKGLMARGVGGVAVVTFSNETTLEQALTQSAARVSAALARARFVPPPGYRRGGVVVAGPPPSVPASGASGMWDAAYVVSNEVLSPSPDAGRRAALFITDGIDTSSRVKPDAAIKSAWKSGAAFYAVGVGDEEEFEGVDEGALRRLAERTGGRALFPKKPGELAAAFEQIGREFLSQYVVTFAADGVKGGGSLHKVKLEVVNPSLRKQGLDLAYPQGFYGGDAPAAVRK